jgi:hypothetical protein
MKLTSFWAFQIGFFLVCAYAAYIQRGYFAFGGEWLIPYSSVFYTIFVLIKKRWHDDME